MSRLAPSHLSGGADAASGFVPTTPRHLHWRARQTSLSCRRKHDLHTIRTVRIEHVQDNSNSKARFSNYRCLFNFVTRNKCDNKDGRVSCALIAFALDCRNQILGGNSGETSSFPDVGWLEHKGVGAGIVAMDLVVNAGRNQ